MVLPSTASLRHTLIAGGWLLAAGTAQALPADFRVLTDDLVAPGGVGAEVQASHALPRTGTADGMASRQLLLELSTGLAAQWEASLQLPASRQGSTWHGDGANLELTWIAPHDDDEGGYWGWRAEFGRSRPADAPAVWGWEWRPILGWREDEWHGVLNPAVSADTSSGDRRVRLDLAAKLTRQVQGAWSVGAEYFVEAGPLSRLTPRRERSEIGLLVVDARWGELNLTLGLGKGFAGASEGRVMKLLLSYAWEGAARP